MITICWVHTYTPPFLVIRFFTLVFTPPPALPICYLLIFRPQRGNGWIWLTDFFPLLIGLDGLGGE